MPSQIASVKASSQSLLPRYHKTNAEVVQERRSHERRLLRRHRLAELLWKLGPRPLSEFVDELDRNYDIPDLDRRLERYAELDAQTLRLFGADKLPAAPLHEVRR
jgi:hypothetical protein